MDFAEPSGAWVWRRRKDQGIGASILTTPFNWMLTN